MNREELFDRVYQREYPLLVKIAYHMTYNQTVSEELSQEAFIRYYQNMDKLPKGEDIRYWLIRVVKNLTLNYEKRRSREARANYRFLQEPNGEDRCEGERQLLEDEALGKVRNAVEHLPEKFRTALILKEYGDLSYKEISRIMNISEGNVKVRVFRAREQLQKTIGKGEIHVP